MSIHVYLRNIHFHNVRTLRSSPLAELSGALGDLGTLLPLLIALAMQNSIDLSATLVFSGLTNIWTGLIYGIPLPVQPMKAIASIAISQHFSQQETMAAGLTVGAVVFLLSATGLLGWLNRVVPVPVVKGIQVGAGLALVISAGSNLILPLRWTSPAWDNRILTIMAFMALVLAGSSPRIPYALLVFAAGLAVAICAPPSSKFEGIHSSFWHPKLAVPDSTAWKTGAVNAAVPQLPLTTLNSILAVTSLASSLFPSYPPTPTTTSIGFSVAITNLVGCWFGAMPICHGSGGLAGQYRFGARSGASVVILGLIKLLLGLFAGNAIIPLLQVFPRSLLGVMVFAAGIELAKVGQSVSEKSDLWERITEDNEDHPRSDLDLEKAVEQQRNDRWIVMLITAGGCLAFKNDAMGFLMGLVWHWSLRLSESWQRRRSLRITIGHDERIGQNV